MRRLLTIFLLGFCIFTLNGCIAGILGGAAGVGSYFFGKGVADRDDRKLKTEALVKVKEELEVKQAALSAQDIAIGNDLSSKLISGAFDDSIAIYPEVKNGVIILHGRVPNAQMAQSVIDSARTTPGVERIISNLVILDEQQYYDEAMMQQPQPIMQEEVSIYSNQRLVDEYGYNVPRIRLDPNTPPIQGGSNLRYEPSSAYTPPEGVLVNDHPLTSEYAPTGGAEYLKKKY